MPASRRLASGPAALASRPDRLPPRAAGRVGPWRRRAALTLAGLLAAGCAATVPAPRTPAEAPPARPSPRPPESPPRSPGDPAGNGLQALFRVRFEGPEGEGSLRLVLRSAAPDRFQLSAADTLGRALWALEVAGTGSLLVDHRRELFCTGAAEVRLPQAALAPLPLATLPEVLLGRLPVRPEDAVGGPGGDPGASAEPAAAELDFRDRAGRRWTARLEAGAPASWTLWEGGRPVLWWRRDGDGGILSQREGSQFRWRPVVREALAGGLERLEAPAEYAAGGCLERPQI